MKSLIRLTVIVLVLTVISKSSFPQEASQSEASKEGNEENQVQVTETEESPQPTITEEETIGEEEATSIQEPQKEETNKEKELSYKPPKEESGLNLHEGIIPTVKVRYGSLTLLGIIQAKYDFKVQGTNFDNATNTFMLERSRIILKGNVVSENLQYFFQGDAVNSDSSFVLDAALIYNIPSWKLSFKVGRYVPDFSIMMPRSAADLGTINYPIYLIIGNFTIWRQLGITVYYNPTEKIGVTLGIFNGMIIEPTATYRYSGIPTNTAMYMGLKHNLGLPDTSSYRDNNMHKDILFSLNLKLFDGFNLGLQGWIGFPKSYKVKRNEEGKVTFSEWVDDTDKLFMGGLSGEYRKNNLHIAGEFMIRYVRFAESLPVAINESNEPTSTINSIFTLGAWLHLGYLFNDWLEPVFRIEWLEPSMNSNYTKDQLFRLTVGPHFWLEKENHFRILLEYFLDYYYQDDTKDPIHNLQIQFQALW